MAPHVDQLYMHKRGRNDNDGDGDGGGDNQKDGSDGNDHEWGKIFLGTDLGVIKQHASLLNTEKPYKPLKLIKFSIIGHH